MELIQFEKVEILLDKTNYQCGETLSGSVNIKLNGELDLLQLKIVFQSKSEVDWVEIYGEVYYNYHDSDQHVYAVYDMPNSLSNSKLRKGDHSIPFEFNLPDDLRSENSIPTSIQTNDGFNTCWIEVIINYDPLDQEVYLIKKYFIVERPFRFGLHISVGGGTEKNLGLLSLGSGKIRIDSSIRKKGYKPGDTVEVLCLVTNTSSVAVTPRAQFYQTEIFMAKGKHKTLGYTTDILIGEKVNAVETMEQIIKVQIPSDMPLSMKTRLISVKYFIHVTLDIPNAFDLHLNLPIIITNENAINDMSESLD